MVMRMIHEEVRKKIVKARKKIVKARKKGMRVADICETYDVGKSAVYDLLKLEEETGGIRPRTDACGRKLTLEASELAAIDQLIQDQGDITLVEIKEMLGLGVCISTISFAIRNKLGYRYKKRQHTPVNESDQM